MFTGATRSSLVVLPLALALPDAYIITAVVIITHALVEVLGRVVYIRAVPRLFHRGKQWPTLSEECEQQTSAAPQRSDIGDRP